MSGSLILFMILAIAAVAAAVGMLLSRSAVYSALFLIINFSTVAVIYLTLDAPFIALAQITVYAGAIMVLFLFVIMLLGADKLSMRSQAPAWQQGLGIVLGLLVMGEAAYVIVFHSGMTAPLSLTGTDFASPTAIGTTLFNQYLLPFEITSVLLLVALVGAIVLTRPEKVVKGRHLVTPETQQAEAASPAPQPERLLMYENEITTQEETGGEQPSPGGDDLTPR
ncbi:MAG TPA: NADH-quinone oxidoreductase subunit J [Anaerolineaceae bacterium]